MPSFWGAFAYILSDMKIPILYHDAHTVVVDKPAGIAVHRGAGVDSGSDVSSGVGAGRDTVASLLVKQFPQMAMVGASERDASERPGVVHRLDKDTSGVLLFALDNEALLFYQSQWKERRVVKEYRAVVAGILEPMRGTIEAPVSRDPRHRQRMTARNATGKMAVSHYEVLAHFRDAAVSCTYISVVIETGRTHQIRAHFSAIGFPVLGDAVYGKRSTCDVARRDMGLDRPFLHAYRLEVALFPTDTRKTFISELPVDLSAVLDGLRG